jgi:hypothetical protein
MACAALLSALLASHGRASNNSPPPLGPGTGTTAPSYSLPFWPRPLLQIRPASLEAWATWVVCTKPRTPPHTHATFWMPSSSIMFRSLGCYGGSKGRWMMGGDAHHGLHMMGSINPYYLTHNGPPTHLTYKIHTYCFSQYCTYVTRHRCCSPPWDVAARVTLRAR